MPEFVCEDCGARESHENAETLKIMENVHKNFCRKKEGKDFSYVHRDSDHPSIDAERETDDKGNPVLKK